MVKKLAAGIVQRVFGLFYLKLPGCHIRFGLDGVAGGHAAHFHLDAVDLQQAGRAFECLQLYLQIFRSLHIGIEQVHPCVDKSAQRVAQVQDIALLRDARQLNGRPVDLRTRSLKQGLFERKAHCGDGSAGRVPGEGFRMGCVPGEFEFRPCGDFLGYGGPGSRVPFARVVIVSAAVLGFGICFGFLDIGAAVQIHIGNEFGLGPLQIEFLQYTGQVLRSCAHVVSDGQIDNIGQTHSQSAVVNGHLRNCGFSPPRGRAERGVLGVCGKGWGDRDHPKGQNYFSECPGVRQGMESVRKRVRHVNQERSFRRGLNTLSGAASTTEELRNKYAEKKNMSAPGQIVRISTILWPA